MKNVTKMILFRLLAIALSILSLVVPAITCKFIYWLIFNYEWHGIIGWKVPAHWVSNVLERVDNFISAIISENMFFLIIYVCCMMVVIVLSLVCAYGLPSLLGLWVIKLGFTTFYKFSVNVKNKALYDWEEKNHKEHKERISGKDAAEKVWNRFIWLLSLGVIGGNKKKKASYQENSQSYYQDDFNQWQEEDARRRAEYEQYYRQQEQYSNSYQQADNSTVSDLKKAMIMYGIDDMYKVEKSYINKTYTRLIKTFHPDNGSAEEQDYLNGMTRTVNHYRDLLLEEFKKLHA